MTGREVDLSGLQVALAQSARSPWALDEARAGTVAAVITDLSLGKEVSASRLGAAVGGANLGGPPAARPQILPAARGGKSTALVSCRGVILYDLEYQPYAVSARRLAQTMRQLAADPSIGRIILAIDSPGGTVTGVEEAADAVFAARAIKPVVAMVDPLCASAAYWIASQASKINCTPSGDVGSIGVFMLHVDVSQAMAAAGIKPTFIFAGEHKVEGNSYEPLGPEAKAYLQAETNAIYGAFLRAVARGRGVSAALVQQTFGKGRTVSAREAKRLGMIDGLGTLDDVVNQVASTQAHQASDEQSARRRRLDLLRWG